MIFVTHQTVLLFLQVFPLALLARNLGSKYLKICFDSILDFVPTMGKAFNLWCEFDFPFMLSQYSWSTMFQSMVNCHFSICFWLAFHLTLYYSWAYFDPCFEEGTLFHPETYPRKVHCYFSVIVFLLLWPLHSWISFFWWSFARCAVSRLMLTNPHHCLRFQVNHPLGPKS